MPFDANLVLADNTADWTFANINTSDYGTPVSTTRNAGGLAVLDLGATKIGGPVSGWAIVLILTEAGAASDDALTCKVEESSVVAFGSDVHELGKFDEAAATTGIILGSEAPIAIVMRVAPKLRYLRIDASMVSGDDFGVVWCLLSPYPFRVL